MNYKDVSKNSWAFDPGDSGDLLVKEVRGLIRGGNYDLAVVLGSGWHEAATLGKLLGVLDYRDWPCFPVGQTAGHSGQLFAVEYSDWNILFFAGRFHCYQGLSAFQAAFPVRLASALGCPRILLTCATGGINRAYLPGDFMLVEDHLNMLGDNPLRGLEGDTFIDLVGTYQQQVYDQLLSCDNGAMVMHRGVLAAMPGPSYETAAEIRFLASSGADVVSMSTVPEAIMARYLGMQVAAVALITNHAAGLNPAALTHQEVLACGSQQAHLFPRLIAQFVASWQGVNAISPA